MREAGERTELEMDVHAEALDRDQRSGGATPRSQWVGGRRGSGGWRKGVEAAASTRGGATNQGRRRGKAASVLEEEVAVLVDLVEEAAVRRKFQNHAREDRNGIITSDATGCQWIDMTSGVLGEVPVGGMDSSS